VTAESHAAVAKDLRPVLGTLKDVAGISGSFAVGKTGGLIARDMPAMFDDIALSEAGERLIRMGETLADVGDQLDVAIVRFSDHKLYLKVLSAGMLCVLAEPSVNLAALRMAVNLVGRRISPALEQIGSDTELERAEDTIRTPIPNDASRMPAGATVRSAVAAPTATRRFRGRTV
jgi:predicted regulator of Ras-like GTPase activity (Roadblock/LC7/MglB family)